MKTPLINKDTVIGASPGEVTVDFLATDNSGPYISRAKGLQESTSKLDTLITLYDSSETDFTTNGIGILSDALTCVVTEERNGEFELEMTYPLNGRFYHEIKINRIIFVKSNPYSSRQAFRIYSVTQTIGFKATINAEHISYQQSKIPVMPFSASSCAEALQGLKTHAAEECPFEFWTDKEIASPYTQKKPASLRQRLGGDEDSILARYKGEYEFDNWMVKLWMHRGEDRGVVLRYGKNLTDFEQEESIAKTYTGVCPYWIGNVDEEDILVTLPEKVLHSENADLYPYQLTIPVDLSDKFDNEPTEAMLRSAAQSYMSDNKIGTPDVNMKVSFIALRQTAEYGDIAPLERVYLCDTVTVIFEELNVSAQAEVIKTVYDALTDRYNSIEIGDPRSSLSKTISDYSNQISTVKDETKSTVDREISRATDRISGALGGYVIMNYDANGHPYEILVMDTDDKTTAVNVIRINKEGIGFSQSGYDGPFNSAWTIDSHFVADYITSGTLNANLLKAGIIMSRDGTSWWNLETGEMVLFSSGVYTGSGENLDNKLKEIEDKADDNNLNVVIESSAGNIFKNRGISTILTAHAYYGSTEVTNDVTKWEWVKHNADGTTDPSWSRDSANVITISEADVQNRAVFYCFATYTR